VILDRDTLSAIRDGTVSLVFRRWRRPTVKAGGTLRTSAGVLAIDGVEEVVPDDLTVADAQAAGFAELASLRRALNRRSDGRVYRIRVRFQGPDPRAALREAVPDAEELRAVVDQLIRRGHRAHPTPLRLLELIRDRPATRAAELAIDVEMEVTAFKRRVRALKELGLTESLEVGYRLSPRGVVVLGALEGASAV